MNINKLKYTEELLGIIFLYLGVAFVLMGILCFAGVIEPSAISLVQLPVILGAVYILIGTAFLIASAALKTTAVSKGRLYNELLAHGDKVNGRVEKVYLQRYTQYGRRSPYRIIYTYTYQGKACRGKSRLMWEKPNLTDGDLLTVYADASGKSAVQETL